MDGEDFVRRAAPFELPETGPDLLRFLTCGSVDDGKSTLIGRLLAETGGVTDDQLATLARDSRRFGTTGDDLDYALLLDGLEAEREQGITIDVAYRYFSTPRRRFIAADTPGHEQYTRNMATGASTCELAVILVDATRGLTDQTRRHSRIVALFGIRQVVLAINKIDLVEDAQARFTDIRDAYAAFASELGLGEVTAIPLSARRGDNLTRRSPDSGWYSGPTLLEALEAAPVAAEAELRPFRFAVQYVNRPDASFRGYAGTVTSGAVRVGDTVAINPSGQNAILERIVTWDGDRAEARAGDAVTLVLDRAVDVARGDVLSLPQDRPASVDRLAARVLWMDDQPLKPGDAYQVRIGTRGVSARLSLAANAETPSLNTLTDLAITLSGRIALDRFTDDPQTGALVITERLTGAVVAAGVVVEPLDQPAHVHPVPAPRPGGASLHGQAGGVVWLTGLSGSGKSTIAAELARQLNARGVAAVVLDGDNLRHGLNRNLGFSDDDRAEAVRRAGEAARLFADAGLVAICALISPQAAARDAVRARFDEGQFVEVFVDTPLAVCQARDPKGLYARAHDRRIENFTGVSSTYERPAAPEFTVDAVETAPDAAAARVMDALAARRWFHR